MKPGDDVKLDIQRQGGVIVNGAFIHKAHEDLVTIEIDCKTKRGYVDALIYGGGEVGIGLLASPESPHILKEKSEELTLIYLPEFQGWSVWAAEYGRYGVQVCLYKDHPCS